MPNSTADYQAPTVENKARKPPGILPRNAQTWLLGGIAIAMVLVIGFSGDQQPPKKSVPAGTPVPIDPNEARIQEYRVRIEEQRRKLAAEQAQLVQARAALTSVPGGPLEQTALSSARHTKGSSPYRPPSPARETTWVQAEKEKREYESLFASNIALSRRIETGRDTTPSMLQERPVYRDSEKRSEDNKRGRGEKSELRNPPRAEEPTYRLFEGTVIETVLTNRLDGGFSGPLNCMVTTNVYSHDGLRLLIPQGSRVLGEVQKVEAFGQQRLAVSFHRLIRPDGYSLSLDQFQGLNQIGETGLRDQVDHHYLQVFGVSLAIGAIAGLSQANARYGYDASVTDAYRQGVGSSLSQSSLRILERYLNVFPTFTIREGHRVKVYLSQDLLLPAYEKHSASDV